MGGPDSFDRAAVSSHFFLEEASITKVLSTASELFSMIEASFSPCLELHTWRREKRWAMKAEQGLLQFKGRLRSARSTEQRIGAIDHFSKLGWGRELPTLQ